jgi:hypothetical protein
VAKTASIQSIGYDASLKITQNSPVITPTKVSTPEHRVREGAVQPVGDRVGRFAGAGGGDGGVGRSAQAWASRPPVSGGGLER